MSRAPSDPPRQPLVTARDTHLVASLLNRAVAGFDIAALSVAEAIFLADILDRAIRALWLAPDHDLRIHLGGSGYQPFPEQDKLERLHLARARASLGRTVRYLVQRRPPAQRHWLRAPNDRHAGRDATILAHRRHVYERARRRHPSRWSRTPRQWRRTEVVRLNPQSNKEELSPIRSAA